MLNPDCLQGDEFLTKFTTLLDGLIGLGMTKKEAIKAACSQQFVKDFADTPDWFVSAKKLPKGFRWSDGEKYKIRSKHGKHQDTTTYVLLEIDNDLYINGLLIQLVMKEDGTYVRKAKISVIKDWRNINPHEITYRLDVAPSFNKSFYDFCSKKDVYAGYVKQLTKKYECEKE